MSYLIAEIGINHNGSLETAFDLIYQASEAGFDAVKFQKRSPRLCVPSKYWDEQKITPWGKMSYIDYREKMEFSRDQFQEINDYCEDCGIEWFASIWDENSLDFIQQFNTSIIKIPSAKITQMELLAYVAKSLRPGQVIMISTGMSTMEEIDKAVEALDHNCVIMHSTSTYPCPLEELNLKMIQTLKRRHDCPVGYSGHEVGLATTVCAVALGAEYIERHITLDRTMRGSDHAASVEPQGMKRLVRDIRAFEKALGNGVKQVYDSEKPALEKLRGV